MAEGSIPIRGVSADDQWLQKADILVGDLFCAADKPFGEPGTAAFFVVGDDDFIAQAFEQEDGLDADLNIVVVGEFVAEEVDAAGGGAELTGNRWKPVTVFFIPAAQSGLMQQGHGAFGGKSHEFFYPARLYEAVIEAGRQRSQPGGGGEPGDQPAAQGYAIGVVIVLEEFGFQFGHVYIGRAFRLAAFAAETKVHHFIDLFMIIAVGLRGMGQKFAEDIGPVPGSYPSRCG